MSDGTFVSVKSGKMRVTLSRAYVEGLEGVEVLDLPATNLRGEPLSASRIDGRAAKQRTTVKEAAAKKAASEKTAASSEPADTNTGGPAADSA